MPEAGPLKPAQRRGPIFIVGAQGSGSTLLRLILDSHDNIAIPQETGFMRAYNAHQFIPFKWSGRNWAMRMGWSREELDQELAAFYHRIFSRNVERHGKQRWGDKTPFHTWHIDDMARVFPDALFVGIVRHPGGNVASNMSRFGHPFQQAVSHVNRYNRELARQADNHRDRFAIVRYEELVLRSEPLLRELLEWLGEPWSERVLEHHTVQAEREGRQTVEGQSRRDDPIDASRISKWQTTLTERQQRALGRSLGRLGSFFGYSVDDPLALEPLGRDGELLISGATIGARIDRYPDLALRHALTRPLNSRFYHPARLKLHSKAQKKPETPPAPPVSEVEPPFLVRLWRVLPQGTRLRLHPWLRRGRKRVRRIRKRLRRPG